VAEERSVPGVAQRAKTGWRSLKLPGLFSGAG